MPVLAVLVPLDRAGPQAVRAAGLEPRLQLQHRRPYHLRQRAPGTAYLGIRPILSPQVPSKWTKLSDPVSLWPGLFGREPDRAVGRPAVYLRRDHVRRAHHRPLGPTHLQHLPHGTPTHTRTREMDARGHTEPKLRGLGLHLSSTSLVLSDEYVML